MFSWLVLHWPDAVNGFFEGGAGAMIWLNVRALLRDRKVRGASLWATAFFTGWGWWNLWYYPHLGQWLSFGGGLLIVAANTVWITLAVNYRKN